MQMKPKEPRGSRGVTPRALIFGCLLLPLNAYWVTQMETTRYQGHPTTVSLLYNSVFTLVLLVLLSAALQRISPRLAFHRNELLVVYCMQCIGSVLTGHDLAQVVTPQIVMPYWLATPENKWEDLFFQYIPKHLTISDPKIWRPAFDGGTTFYTKERILAWLGPAGNWATFLAVLSLMMLAMNTLLRRRWIDREKLTYPITHMPLELTRPGAPLLRNKLMWIGFALAAAVDIVNGLHELYPGMPLIKVRVVHYDAYMSTLFRGYPWGALSGTRISFYPFAIGMGMLLPLDLAFSCWFFYLFWKAQSLLSAMVGLSRIPGFPYVPEQSSAAYLGLCAFALWMARDQLSEIWRGLMQGGHYKDEGEPTSYNTALWVLFGGAIYLIIFSARMGMWIWLAALLFIIYFMISLAVTRIRAELGPPAHDLHGGGPDLILTNLFGTAPGILDAKQLTNLSMCFWFNRAYRAHPMPIQLEAFKIAETAGIPLRGMALALALAAVVGSYSAFWAQIHQYYTYGIAAKMHGVAQIFGREPYQRLQSWLVTPFPTRWPRIGAYGTGFLFTLALMFLRVNFVWWPFHPVGYAISSSWSMNCLWLPILIAWAIKATILRYGGYKMFQGAIPIALGLVLGEFVVGSIWTLIGIILQINTYAFWV
jgi:hypothetical protein